MSKSGIDWISCSRSDHEKFAAYERLLLTHWDKLISGKNKPKPTWRLGYYGTATPHSFVGRREDGTFFQASSDLAASVGLAAIELSENVSRLDLQVTVKVTDSVPFRLEGWLHAAYDAPKRRGKPAKVTYHGGQAGLETVYIGSKASDERGRIYDKFAESGEEGYRNYVRFEVQFRNKRALAAARIIQNSAQPYRALAAIVKTWFNERGVVLPDLEELESEELPKNELSGGIEGTLSWFATQVGPAIRKALGEASVYAVATALTQNLKEIVPYTACMWGIVQLYRNYTNEGETYADATILGGRSHLAHSYAQTRHGHANRAMDKHVGGCARRYRRA